MTVFLFFVYILFWRRIEERRRGRWLRTHHIHTHSFESRCQNKPKQSTMLSPVLDIIDATEHIEPVGYERVCNGLYRTRGLSILKIRDCIHRPRPGDNRDTYIVYTSANHCACFIGKTDYRIWPAHYKEPVSHWCASLAGTLCQW